MSLRRSDLFGSTVLDAEESYSFTLAPDEDDDVTFGADLDDVPLFSESFGGSDDDQLDQILADMEADEGYGEDALAVAPMLEGYRSQLAEIVLDGVRNSVIGEADGVQGLFRTSAEYVSNKMQQVFKPGDAEEIAQAILANQGFCDWNNLSDADREDIVHKAIWYAMVPGVELSADDKLWDAWQSGLANLPSSAFEVAKAALTDDLPKMVRAALAENSVIGNAMQAAGWDPRSADQLRNETAMGLWAIGKLGLPVDAYVAKAITDQGQDIIAACQAVEGGGEVVDVASERMVDEFVASPTQEISDGGLNMPSPEQILAFGYGVSILGSLAGIFA